MKKLLFNEIGLSFLLVFINTLAGVFGFMIVEGWGFLDSFYQTIITISTIGFTEVQPFTENGKIFVSIYIITTLGTFAYALSQVTNFFVSGDYKKELDKNRMNSKMNKMENHVIVCGYGRVGSQTVETLLIHNEKVVVIENGEEFDESSFKDKNFLFIKANASNDQTLIKAGIAKAKAIITTLPSDADNLFLVLSARELNEKLIIISRAEHISSVKKLKIAGAHNVIMPDKLGGTQMAQMVATPDVVEFLDLISVEGKSEVNLVEIAFKDLPENFQNASLADIKCQVGCGNIIGYKNANGDFIINPSEDTKVVANSKFFILGTPADIQQFKKTLHIQ
jgi:voltage-gated potassium channel